MTKFDAILDRIRQRLTSAESPTDAPSSRPKTLPAIATESAIENAESIIGLRLPLLLHRMYSEIANGGFGPAYGFIGVDGGATDDLGNSIVDLHIGSQTEQFRTRFPNWPKGVVRFCYWGCAMYSAIDCLAADFPVYHFEPNSDERDLGFVNCLIPHNRTFNDYIDAWLTGVDLMNDVFPGYHEDQ